MIDFVTSYKEELLAFLAAAMSVQVVLTSYLLQIRRRRAMTSGLFENYEKLIKDIASSIEVEREEDAQELRTVMLAIRDHLNRVEVLPVESKAALQRDIVSVISSTQFSLLDKDFRSTL
jgi:hypothetical protein